MRLTPAQIDLLAPGLALLVHSYKTHLRKGASPLAYPFRIYPPPRGFLRGEYNQDFMDKILELAEIVRTKPKSGRRAKLDTWHFRATVFAIRAYLDYLRLLRRQQRHKSRAVKAQLRVDNRSLALLKGNSARVIHSLERHMKRANRASAKAIGSKQFSTLTNAWRAHLHWMRLHLVYCKPWGKPVAGRRARQQRDLDELMEIPRRGLIEEGYKPPEDKELRHLMRLYARYAREGRIGGWIVGLLHEDKERFLRKYHLAQFVIERSKLKELSKP